MGCAVGIAASGRLRETQREVHELKRLLEASELEKGDLRRRLEAVNTAKDPPENEVQVELREVPEVSVTCRTVAVGPSECASAGSKASGGDAGKKPPQSAVEERQEEVPPGTASSGSIPDNTAAWDEPEVSILPGVVAWEPLPYTEAAGDQDGNFDPWPPDELELPSCKAVRQRPRPELSPKLSATEISTASTCTPGALPPNVLRRAACGQCSCEGVELFLDPSDLNQYCESCWQEYYGSPPERGDIPSLVAVEVSEFWEEDRLAIAWVEQMLPGWPPPMVPPPTASSSSSEGEVWSNVSVRVRRDVVGPHAREQLHGDRPYPGDRLAGRYRIESAVGEGHFTKAFLAEDLKTGASVCVKRHRSLSVEALADLMVLGRRIEAVDAGGKVFPRLIDAFFDLVGFTVESLIEGRNCLTVAQSDARFFRDLGNLRHVARGALHGLALLEQAGVVHNDVKPDNLIWVEPADGGGPSVRIVDFGCARLDHREEQGRNWSLAEGGAGHLGKWSPEMALRLPITHRGDVWGLAVSLCELHCGRSVWRHEADTAEVVLAQSLGLCGLREGLPSSLLRRSPLDVRQLYTPAPRHWPLRRNSLGQLEVLRPVRWGLEQVLGESWRENGKGDFAELLQTALVVDPAYRPSAAQLLECCCFVAPSSSEGDPSEGMNSEDGATDGADT